MSDELVVPVWAEPEGWRRVTLTCEATAASVEVQIGFNATERPVVDPLPVVLVGTKAWRWKSFELEAVSETEQDWPTGYRFDARRTDTAPAPPELALDFLVRVGVLPRVYLRVVTKSNAPVVRVGLVRAEVELVPVQTIPPGTPKTYAFDVPPPIDALTPTADGSAPS